LFPQNKKKSATTSHVLIYARGHATELQKSIRYRSKQDTKFDWDDGTNFMMALTEKSKCACFEVPIDHLFAPDHFQIWFSLVPEIDILRLGGRIGIYHTVFVLLVPPFHPAN